MPCQQTKTELDMSLATARDSSELINTGCDSAEAGVVRQKGGRLLAAIASVVVTPASITLAADETVQLTAKATDAFGNVVDVTAGAVWTTADALVATVDQAGKVTAIGTGGPTNITATFSGQADACAVTVS